MELERVPHLVLAQALVKEIEYVLDVSGNEKRLLIGKFSDILRPVCNATEEAFTRGFDEGAKYERDRRSQ